MVLPIAVASLVKSWAAFYDAHHAVSVTVRFLHLGAIVVGGGSALAADWRILWASRAVPSRRLATIAGMASIHRVVLPALAVVALSGVLQTAADTATFLASRLYWTKLGFVTLLLANGVALLVAEAAARRGEGVRGWVWLALTSGASLVLWLGILYLGLWLTVAA
jgi:hypothetical protein